jgi:hypothetical protein
MKKLFLAILICAISGSVFAADGWVNASGTWTVVSTNGNVTTVSCPGEGHCYSISPDRKVYTFDADGNPHYEGQLLAMYREESGDEVDPNELSDEFDGSEYLLEFEF